MATQQAETAHTPARIAEAIPQFMPLPTRLENNFEGALQHVLGNPGNLVRPQLIFRVGTAYGLSEAHAQNLAIALEYFHTASLLFDDLPCMDNALERRGAPCTHLLFGEDSAILTALALINRAYGLLWSAVSGCAERVRSTAQS